MPAADATVWEPEVDHRLHPFGEKGVFSSLEEVADRVAKGALSPRVRLWAIECLDRARVEQGLQANNDRERAEILLRAVQKKLWVPDPVGAEWMAGTHLMACDPAKDGVCFRGGDCFAQGTLMLKKGHELVPVEELRVGDRIWGLNRWSEVQAVQYKGVLPIDVITLNNGSEVKLTSNHHVYVLDCREHPMLTDEEEARTSDRHWYGCLCAAEMRIEKRCRVSELREEMVLLSPELLPETSELDVRTQERVDGHRPWVLRVKSIECQIVSVPCWDIQTDDHRVYLAEHDVTVSNCDDLVILLGACLSSVGIYTMIIGHAYDRQKNISHVLCAAHVKGRWMYADPSTKLPLGECVRFTRERIYSVPNIQMLCDANVCLENPSKYNPEKSNFINKGEFVGVNGPPTFTWLGDPDRTVEWIEHSTWLGEGGGNPYSDCLNDTLNSDLNTAAGREAAAKKGGRCAVDAYCAVQSGGAIPPGVCSYVAGPVIDVLVGVFSDIFGGGGGIDCSKVSVIDPCHACNYLKAISAGSITRFTPYRTWAAQDPACVKWALDAPAMIERETKVAFDRELLVKHDKLLNDALAGLRALGLPDQVPDLIKGGYQYLGSVNYGEEGTAGKIIASLYSIAPAFESAAGQKLISGSLPPPWLRMTTTAPSSKSSKSALPVVAGLALAGGLAWALFA